MKNMSFLSKAEMKKVLGGVGEEGGRCKSDVLCSFDGPQGQYEMGGCESIGSKSQCRCVSYRDGAPFASVPHSGCLAGGGGGGVE